jgi:hypothetical protein
MVAFTKYINQDRDHPNRTIRFRLSAFLCLSGRMSLKLTLKVDEFCGHLFLEGSLDVVKQNKKVNQNRTFRLRVIRIPQIVTDIDMQIAKSITIHAKRL